MNYSRDLNKLCGRCCIAMSVKSLSGSLKASFSLSLCLDFMQSMFIYLQMNPNEEPFRFCDVQKISAATEAPHI